MTPRPALASVPDPPEPWHNVAETAEHFGVSHDVLERLVREGCPAVDVAHHHPLRRRRRVLRFQFSAVERWLQERGR